MKNGEHHYNAHLIWDGNLGDGTATYAGYGRQYRVVTIADATHLDRAKQLHERAHELCFIASSCSVPIHHEANVVAR